MAVAAAAKRVWADVATVTLVVGETKTAFHVHEANLFEASPFFKAAFTSDFRESSERTMTLPEDDENVFDLFVDWLYHRRYEIAPPPESAPEDYDRFMQPVQLFVLADKYDVRKLKNLVLYQLFLTLKHAKDSPALTTFAYAYKHTSQSSTIRKVLADHLTYSTELTWFSQASIQTWFRDHPDISVDVITSFAKYTLKEEDPFIEEMPENYIEKEPEGGK